MAAYQKGDLLRKHFKSSSRNIEGFVYVMLLKPLRSSATGQDVLEWRALYSTTFEIPGQQSVRTYKVTRAQLEDGYEFISRRDSEP